MLYVIIYVVMNLTFQVFKEVSGKSCLVHCLRRFWYSLICPLPRPRDMIVYINYEFYLLSAYKS